MNEKVELLGYLASVLVAVSLMMRSVTRLRMVNLMGAICFSAYGFLIGSMPVAGMNAFIAAINVYHLAKLLRAESTFAVIEVRPDAANLRAFVEFHAADLSRFFPPQRWRTIPDDARTFMILRDAAPIGLVVAARADERTLRIDVDYVVADYRDLKPGRHFYERHAPQLKHDGITRLTAESPSPQHAGYLREMGFTPTPDDLTHYERTT